MIAKQLKDDWADVYVRANALFKRSNTRRVHATLHQEYAEGHRDKAAELAALVESARDAHTPHTDKSETEQAQAAAANTSGWDATRSIRAGISRASKAAAEAEELAAADVSRYTDWLLGSPVARGTASFLFGDARPADKASLEITFSSKNYLVWKTQSNHIAYE